MLQLGEIDYIVSNASAGLPPPPYEIFQNLLIEQGYEKREIVLIMRAYSFSKAGHEGQHRDDGSRFFDHPKILALQAFAYYGIHDMELIIELLIHDLREDSHLLKFQCIQDNFGLNVAKANTAVTKGAEENTSHCIGRLRRLLQWQPSFGKCLDREHNLRTLKLRSAESNRSYKEKTREYFLDDGGLIESLLDKIPPMYRSHLEDVRSRISKLCV